jgi:hypothetical protein
VKWWISGLRGVDMAKNSEESTKTVAGEIRETSILYDHDFKIVMVDTTEVAMANKFRKIGLEELTSPASGRYFRFKGEADMVRVFGKRKLSATSQNLPKKPLGAKRRNG